MITDLVVQALLAVVGSVVTLIPGGASVTFMDNVSVSVLGWVRAGNGFLPVSMALTCLMGLLALQLALGLWDLILWIYHQVWGSS